jgi:hypothetical protein
MSDAIENEMRSAPPELMQIAANYEGSNSTEVPKSVICLHNASDEKYLATKVKFLSSLEEEL